MTRRIETWKRIGQVLVSRDSKGRFTSHWQHYSPPSDRFHLVGKHASVYGNTETGRGIEPRRYQLYGSGRSLQRAMIVAIRHPPKVRFLTIGADEFLSSLGKYVDMGAIWIDRPEVKS
jgi:hypothetical protein